MAGIPRPACRARRHLRRRDRHEPPAARARTGRLRRSGARGLQRSAGRHTAGRRQRSPPIVPRGRRRRHRDRLVRRVPRRARRVRDRRAFGRARPTLGRARPRGRPTATRRRTTRASSPAASGPGRSSRRSVRSPSPRCATPTRSRRRRSSRAASTCCRRDGVRPVRAKAALVACRRAMAATGITVPLQVQVTIELTGRMLPGTEIARRARARSRRCDPTSSGSNCATGPVEMYEPLRYLGARRCCRSRCCRMQGSPRSSTGRCTTTSRPTSSPSTSIASRPSSGCRRSAAAAARRPRTSTPSCDAARGSTPVAPPRRARGGRGSLYSFVPFDQELSFLVIGERTNANGSKQFREAMLAGDFDTTTAMARDQVREGAHLIDVCVDYTGADGVADMREVMSRISTQSTAPVVIDSTEPAVVRTALELVGGRALLNSVNLEDGDGPGTRLDAFLTLAAEHGAAVICTCIDEKGQARTAAWKLAAATRDPRPRRRDVTDSHPRISSSTPSRCPCRPAWKRAGGTASRPSRRSAPSNESSRVSTRCSASRTSPSVSHRRPATC